MRYFLGLIKCPKVGGPDTLAAHKGKKVGGPRPTRPNSFHHLWQHRSLFQLYRKHATFHHKVSQAAHDWRNERCICFSNQVGTGSSSHDLAGESFRRRSISVTVAGRKQLRGGACLATMTGGSADERKLFTLSLKNQEKWSADSFSDVHCDKHSISTTITLMVVEVACLPPATELVDYELTVSNQNAVTFDWYSRRCVSNCCRQAISDSAVRRRR